MKQKILLIYRATGGISTLKLPENFVDQDKGDYFKEGGRKAHTPHTFDGDGHLCTGTYSVGRNLVYEDAKKTLIAVEDQLHIINMGSLASGNILYNGINVSIHSLDLKSICINEQKTLTEVTDGMIL